jgi:hypothetical protein
MKLANVYIKLDVNSDALARFTDQLGRAGEQLETIADRAVAFEHARMVACLIWPWPGREGYHLKDGL